MSAIDISPGSVAGMIKGATGAADNAVLRADGTGGTTLQSSGLIIGDTVNSFAVTGDAGTDVITATGSAFTNGQPVRFTALTGGSGLNTTTNYFVREVSGATFKVETSIGGGAVNFTTNVTAGTIVNAHVVQPLVQVSENTSDANSALVLTPKGTGAFIVGPAPDGDSTGGPARGPNAIDIQTARNNITAATGSNAVALGSRCRASGVGAICLGNNVAVTAQYATALGFKGENGRPKTISGSGGSFVFDGDCQWTRAILRNKTTTNAAVELFLDAGSDGGTTRFQIFNGSVVSMLIHITGVKSDGTAVAHYLRQYCIKNIAGTTSEVYAPVVVGTDNAAGTSIAISANDTNEALKIECTGVLNEIWRWVAIIDTSDMFYGI